MTLGSFDDRAAEVLARVDGEIDVAANLGDLYARVCDLVVGVGGYSLAWVGLAEDTPEKTVLPMAHAGFNSHYIEAIKISWSDQPNGQGPTGTAIRTGMVQVVNSIRTAPSMRPWRELALERGYNACISLPLQDSHATFGVLAILARDENAFDDDHVGRLTLLSRKVSAAVVRLRADVYKHLR